MPDVTIASTTDTIEDVRTAAGLPAAAPKEEQPDTEVEGLFTETEQATEGEEQPEEVEAEGEDAEVEQPRRPKTSVQKRIDKLTAKNYALEEEKEAERKRVRDLESRLAALEAGTKKEDAKPSGDQFSKPRPDQKSFDDYDKFVDALTDWKLEKREFEQQAVARVEAAKQQEERQKETFASYNKAVSGARGEFEDFDEVVGRKDLELPYSIMNAIIGMRAQGPAIAYEVCKNEDLCNYLSQVAVERGDAVALTEFGKWLASGEEPTQQAEEQEAEAPAPVVQPRRAAAPAPKPIKPVGASATRSEKVELDELDFREYRRIRDEQVKNRLRN
jgi:hypothetical protein